MIDASWWIKEWVATIEAARQALAAGNNGLAGYLLDRAEAAYSRLSDSEQTEAWARLGPPQSHDGTALLDPARSDGGAGRDGQDGAPPCKTDPRAPHGFLRNASHSADRYVCECEFWQPDDEAQPHQGTP